jgi:hypothetical protein
MTWKWFDCLHGIYDHVGLNRSNRKMAGPARLIFFSLERWSNVVAMELRGSHT